MFSFASHVTHLQGTVKCGGGEGEGVHLYAKSSGVTRNFFRGGVQQIQLSPEDRDDGDLGAVAP